MPAAPAGRALLPSRSTADLPCPNRATRRGFMLGSSALLASLLLPRSAPAARPPPTQRVDDAAYWAFADRLQDHLDPRWAGRLLPAGALDGQRQPAAHPRRRRARGSRRPGAPRRPRAGAGRRSCATGRRGSRRPAAAARATCPGWRDGLRGGGIQHLVVDTEIAWALSFAWRAREAIGLDQATADLIADRIVTHRERRVLALAGAAAEPDQLVRAHVRGGRGRRRRPAEDLHGAAAASSCGASSTARAGRWRARRSPTSAPATASTTCRALRAPQVQPRQRRVREHRLRLPGRLPAGARRGHAGAGLGPRAGRAGLGRARAGAATGRTRAT